MEECQDGLVNGVLKSHDMYCEGTGKFVEVMGLQLVVMVITVTVVTRRKRYTNEV